MSRRSEDVYLRQVLARIPRAHPARGRIEADLRLHLSDLMGEETGMDVAVERMGHPDRVAAEFLAQLALKPASHGRRFFAFVVDVVVLAAVLLPPSLIAAPWLRGLPMDVVIPLAVAGSGLLTFVYFGVLEAAFGQTAGKWLTGVCVVRDDGSHPGFLAVVIRRIPFVGNFFPIDALFVFFTERRQRAFDKVAGTLVIDCR